MIVFYPLWCWCAVSARPAPFSVYCLYCICCASTPMFDARRSRISFAHPESLSRACLTRWPFATRSALLCAAGLCCLLCRPSRACCLAPAGLASCLAASPAGWAAVHLAAAMQRHRLQPGAHTTTRPARNKLRCAAPTPRPAPTTERRQACPCSAPSAQPCAVRVRVYVCVGGPPVMLIHPNLPVRVLYHLLPPPDPLPPTKHGFTHARNTVSPRPLAD